MLREAYVISLDPTRFKQAAEQLRTAGFVPRRFQALPTNDERVLAIEQQHRLPAEPIGSARPAISLSLSHAALWEVMTSLPRRT